MNKFTLNKLGFVDFWFYDLQEFDLSNGKLLLRGSNGSGKSVTMQSFIPLVLDGNKTPSRIDPSGTNDKRVENYMLDETRNERTSYLYMEFKNNDSYTTIGMGLKAEKNKPLDSWYFILNDGRRINIDLFLYEGTTDKIALTKQKLQNRLPSGFFTTKQKEYMKKVNELIFGYQDPESFEDLLNLLIQVRAPKVSKDFKPQLLYEILKNSLKILDEDDLKPISESMQNMDDLRRRKNLITAAYKSAQIIKARYDSYNKKLLVTKAEQLLDALNQWKMANVELRSMQKDLSHLEKELTDAKELQQLKTREYDSAKLKLEEYKESDISKLRMLIQLDKDNISKWKQNAAETEGNIEKQNSILNKHFKEIEDYENSVSILTVKTEKLIQEIDELSEECTFVNWDNVTLEKLMQMQTDDRISFYLNDMTDYENRLKAGILAIESKNAAKSILDKWEDEQAAKLDELSSIDRKLSEASRVLADRREEYKISFDNWNNANTIFILSKEERLSLFQTMMSIQDSSSFILISEILHQHFAAIYQKLQLALLDQQNNEKICSEKVNLLEAEIDQLKNTVELEPPRSDATQRFRIALDKKRIAYTPFYKAFDFAANISDCNKNILESALNDMGILDALLIDSKNKAAALKMLQSEDHSDKIIFCDIRLFTSTAQKFFTTEPCEMMDSNVLKGLIQNLFSHQSLSFISENGEYSHGVLQGRADPGYQSKFIGENSRLRYRMQQIEILREKLDAALKELHSLQQSIDEIKDKQSLLLFEKAKAPSYTDIKDTISEIDRLMSRQVSVEAEKTEIDKNVYSSKTNYEQAKAKAFAICKDIPLEKELRVYKSALEDIINMKESFMEIKSNVKSILDFLQFISHIKDSIENIESRLEALRHEKIKIEKQIAEAENRNTSREEILAAEDTSDVKEVIERCTHIVNVYNNENNKLIEQVADLRAEIAGFYRTIEDKKKLITEKEAVAASRKSIFITEAKYEFVLPFDDSGIEGLCNTIITNYKKECPQPIMHYYEALSKTLNENTARLRENSVHLSGNYEDSDDGFGSSGRSLLLCHLDGKEVSFTKLPPALKDEIDEIELMIKENERQIFEDILLNTLSHKIRAKVSLSRLWVEKINRIMSANGVIQRLEFSLKWDGKKAESDEELPIKKVMEILEDDKGVSPEDMDKISKHFGSKIKNKIREAEDKGEHPNYQIIVKEALDYRQWYEFRLFANKDNTGMKELTLKDFNQLSVGERAMAMYIPLFAAVNARYDSADKKCPRIVCMDEAFAGISDNNKRILFTLLKRMSLDYILNSQELWGTYAEVDSLMIYELYREPSDRHVGILKYKWDGVRRTYVE